MNSAAVPNIENKIDWETVVAEQKLESPQTPSTEEAAPSQPERPLSDKQAGDDDDQPPAKSSPTKWSLGIFDEMLLWMKNCSNA